MVFDSYMDRVYRLEHVAQPDGVVVIGLGGVGSWVAYNLGLYARNMALIDPDIVEPHNLSRTPYRVKDIYKPKALAMTEIIMEKRAGTNIRIQPFVARVEELQEEQVVHMVDDAVGGTNTFTVIDCRDNSMQNPLPEYLRKRAFVTAGYDGDTITLHFNPSYSSVFGSEPVRYTITPSWVVPAQLLACMITWIVCCYFRTVFYELRKQGVEAVNTITVGELIARTLNLKIDREEIYRDSRNDLFDDYDDDEDDE